MSRGAGRIEITVQGFRVSREKSGSDQPAMFVSAKSRKPVINRVVHKHFQIRDAHSGIVSYQRSPQRVDSLLASHKWLRWLFLMNLSKLFMITIVATWRPASANSHSGTHCHRTRRPRGTRYPRPRPRSRGGWAVVGRVGDGVRRLHDVGRCSHGRYPS